MMTPMRYVLLVLVIIVSSNFMTLATDIANKRCAQDILTLYSELLA